MLMGNAGEPLALEISSKSFGPCWQPRWVSETNSIKKSHLQAPVPCCLENWNWVSHPEGETAHGEYWPELGWVPHNPTSSTVDLWGRFCLGLGVLGGSWDNPWIQQKAHRKNSSLEDQSPGEKCEPMKKYTAKRKGGREGGAYIL